MNKIDFLPPHAPVKSPSDWIVYSPYYNFSFDGPTVLGCFTSSVVSTSWLTPPADVSGFR